MTALAIPKIEAGTVLKLSTMKSWIETVTPALHKAMPAVAARNPDRYARCLLSLMQGNYKLSTCTALSLMGGMAQAVQLGLELGGPLGQTYLVPRYNKKVLAVEATFQIGYRGLLALAFRSEKVGAFPAYEVFEGDTFDLNLGSKPSVLHKPGVERGASLGCYAVVKYVSGIDDVEWMSSKELTAHQAKYCSADSDAWAKSPGEMRKKTVMRRLGKRVAVSVDLVRAAVLDEYGEQGVDQGLSVEAAQMLGIELPDPVSDETEKTTASIAQPKPGKPRTTEPVDDGDPDYDAAH